MGLVFHEVTINIVTCGPLGSIVAYQSLASIKGPERDTQVKEVHARRSRTAKEGSEDAKKE